MRSATLVRAEIEKVGLHPMTKMWDEGFRQITTSTKPINTPADLNGFKMRVPPSPISLSMFKDLGAAPMTLNAAELYTALQTHLADGQENPLGTIEANKIYEVQKYCSMTSHMWVGYWVLANGSAWKACRRSCRTTVAEAFDAEAPLERADVEALNNSLVPRLESQGMTFNNPRSRTVPRGAGAGRLLQAVAGQVSARPCGARWRNTAARSDSPGMQPRAPRSAANSRRWTRHCGSVTEMPAAILVLVEVGILFAGVIWRYVLNSPLFWSDELAGLLFLWLVMLGAVIALRRGEHMRMTAVVSGLPPRAQRFLATLGALVVAIFVAVILLPAASYMVDENLMMSPALQIPDSWRVAGLLVALVLLLIIALRQLLAAATWGDLFAAAGRRRGARPGVLVEQGLAGGDRQRQPADLLHRPGRPLHRRRRADRLQLRHLHDRLCRVRHHRTGLDHRRPDGPGHVIDRAARRADVRIARAAAGDDRHRPRPGRSVERAGRPQARRPVLRVARRDVSDLRHLRFEGG